MSQQPAHRRGWAALAFVVASGSCTTLAAQTAAPASRSGAAAPAPASHPASAAASADDEDATTVSPVVVTAKKPVYAKMIGAVVGDIEPELMLSPAEVQSYGVSTVTELLNELTPETRSDRGRGGESPVVLLNGRRISSLAEVQNIPTEAILRVDILPEEVSLKYGYTADQRVVNIVLRRRFHATTLEAQGGGPTEGGEVTDQAEADLLHIRRDTRLNLDLKYQGASGLTDADRGVTPPMGAESAAGAAADHSLTPATQSLTANAVLARPVFWGFNGTINATFGANSSDSLRGLAGVGQTTPEADALSPSGSPAAVESAASAPLHQYVDGWTAHFGSTLNKDLGPWRLSITDAWDHADTQTDTDAGGYAATNPGGPPSLPQQVHARAVTDAANLQILANGPVLKLPAGNLYISAKAGDTQSWLSSTAQARNAFQAIYLTRNDANGQLNVDLPIASRRNRFLGFAGEFSLNANAAVDAVSDFGTLKAFGFGLNWTPIPGYNLIVSHTNDQIAPTVQQLGGPVIYTPGAPVFDFLTGQTVDVTQITGGNQGLEHDNRNVTKIGLTIKPLSTQDFTLSANYIKSDIDRAIITLPAASAAIQAAFPASFIRDAEGELIEEDLRPVNLARSERTELRWGINYTRPIGKQPPPRPSYRRYLGANGQPRRPRPDTSAGGAGGSSADGSGPPASDASGGTPAAEPEGRPNPEGHGGYGGTGGGNGPGGGGHGGFGHFTGAAPVGGRLQIALYHTLYFVDRMLPRAGGPTLDLLNGAPATTTGGQYRNEIEAQLGVTDSGFGARLSADWRQGTFVTGSAASPTGNLVFSDIATVNLRLFDNLGQQRSVTRRFPILRGTRISLYISNLFDQRLRVRDALGATPLSYQPGYIDPTGRAITLSLRKLFY